MNIPSKQLGYFFNLCIAFLCGAFLLSSCETNKYRKQKKDELSENLGWSTKYAKAFRELQGDYSVKELRLIKDAIMNDSRIKEEELPNKLFFKILESGDSKILDLDAYEEQQKRKRYSNRVSSRQEFSSESDVRNYLMSNSFSNGDNEVWFKYDGIYMRKAGKSANQLTGAFEVTYYNSYSATISASSPYGGGAHVTLFVNRTYETITDSSGNVFKIN